MWCEKSVADKIWHIEMQRCACRQEYEVEAEVETDRMCQEEEKNKASVKASLE